MYDSEVTTMGVVTQMQGGQDDAVIVRIHAF